MKILITAILLQISFQLNSLSDSLERDNIIVTYNTTFKKYKSRPNLTETLMKLYITDTTSIFIDSDLENIFKLDASDIDDLTGSQIKKAKDRISSIKYFIQKFHNKEYMTLSQEVSRKQFAGYRQEMMLPDIWHIRRDTATIAGLKSLKAECKYGGREWTAWFSPEVPISDGPSKFSGLPGLIVKLESADGDYQFILKGLERLKNRAPKLPDNQIVERDKFKNLRLAYYENLIPPNSKVNLTIEGKLYNREETIEYLKRGELDNNLLELE